MAQTEARTRDPLRNYQFRVGILTPPPDPSSERGVGIGGATRLAVAGDHGQQTYVAGVQKLSGLSVAIGASEVWEGGNNLHRYANPDKATWDPITLEQGLALGDTLETWARATLEFVTTGAAPAGGVAVKRNVVIDIWDPLLHPRGRASHPEGLQNRGSAHQLALGAARLRRYLVLNAWVSRYQALPALDAMANEVALIAVELVHEGWRPVGEDELPSDLRRTQATATEVA